MPLVTLGDITAPVFFLTRPARKTQPPVLLNAVFTQAATYFKSPSLSGYKCFSLQPQPRPHQSPQVTSPHQAGLLSQSGIKGGPSTKHGLVYYLEQTSILLTRKSGMAPYNSPFYIFLFSLCGFIIIKNSISINTLFFTTFEKK